MALTMSTGLGVQFGVCQESPIDLSRRHRSPSPEVSISMGHSYLLDRAMGPAFNQYSDMQQDPQDLRVRPHHPDVVPFHKLKRHRAHSPDHIADQQTRMKKQRLEDTVGLLRVREFSPVPQEAEAEEKQPSESCPPSACPPMPHQLLQKMLLMQRKDPVTSYPSLFYLQYCAMLQSLQLQQALQQRQQEAAVATPVTPPAAANSFELNHHRQQFLRPGASTAAAAGATSCATFDTPQPGPSGSGTRRRAPRTLTGKHVRQGQGASPETLNTLKTVILERARLRALGLLPPPSLKKTAKRRK